MILLSTAVEALGIQGVLEDLLLWTVRDDVQVIRGCSIAFKISPVYRPQISYQISHAFTADHLNLSRQSNPMEQLRRKYRHLRGLPIRTLTEVQPLLLIGSDQPHLITPTEPVQWGVPRAPVAVRTRLGWTHQGPFPYIGCPSTPRQCMLNSLVPVQDELLHHVQRLWQLDTVPNQECKEVSGSKQDQEALQLLDRKTLTLEIEDVRRLVAPLLRHKDMLLLNAMRDSVLPNLRSMERRLLKDPEKALQCHTRQHPLTDEEICFSVERCFYVDNCLQSLPTAEAARSLIDHLHTILSGVGFEIRQWACNDPAALRHLPPEARATSVEMWLTQEKADVSESMLGLSWNCSLIPCPISTDP